MTRAYRNPALPTVELTNDEKCAQILRRQKQRQRQAHGAQGQAIIEAMMRRLGFLCVECIHSGTVMSKGRRVFARKVSGDIRAVAPPARSVLVEIKSRMDGKLSVVHFEPHQIKAMDDHLAAGAISLVGFIAPPDVFLLPWSWLREVMTAGHPVTPEQVRPYSLRALP